MIHPVRYQREKKAAFPRDADVTARTEVKVVATRDPAAKGSITYDIPVRLFETTHGFKEHVAYLSGEGKKPAHRACLCKLFQEGRCRQARKCNSLHVDPAEVNRLRLENGVILQDTFVNEVIVQAAVSVGDSTMRAATFAVRFPAVLKTEGASMCRRDAHGVPPCLSDSQMATATPQITPSILCPDYNRNLKSVGECMAGPCCKYVHVKHEELKEANLQRLRTPCCWYHGDAEFTPYVEKRVSLYFKQERVPTGAAAVTRGLITLAASKKRVDLSCQHVCALHIKSRCKYGRSCGKIHLCRVWAESAKILPEADLNAAVAKADALQQQQLGGSSASTSTSSTPLAAAPASPAKAKRGEQKRRGAEAAVEAQTGALLALGGVQVGVQEQDVSAELLFMRCRDMLSEHPAPEEPLTTADDDDELPPLADEMDDFDPELTLEQLREVLNEEDRASVSSDVPSSSLSNSAESLELHEADFASAIPAAKQIDLPIPQQTAHYAVPVQQPLFYPVVYQHQQFSMHPQQPAQHFVSPFDAMFSWGR